ncbi:MAG: glycosyltransferase family 4 protein [Verrucomicrobia bacterium]|jgi:glycosyltransferase involved in cell wall biosynthesis|nr:glycosyltransferase family 4 protein [Verrucomicrobiota bacterium]
MKLLVFAHTPPPHHGQSLMIEAMVRGFGGDCRQRGKTPADRARQEQPATECGAESRTGTDAVPDAVGSRQARSGEAAPRGASAGGPPHGIEVYHVNARFSASLDDIGAARGSKVFALLKYCAQAAWIRCRYGVRTMYYVPAPAKRTPLIRDWIVMAWCRLWFPRLILHWHAVGLGAWQETGARPWERWLTQRLLGRADLGIVLSEFSRADAEKLRPRRVAVVANGIPDPCPTCDYELLPWRRLRREVLAEALGRPAPAGGEPRETARILYLAHCTRDKGLFDAVAAVARANASLQRRGVDLRLELTVAGEFLSEAERDEFDRLRATHSAWLRYPGFVRGAAKEALFRNADVFHFPTYYANEGQPVSLIEAMAFALPIVTTRWRAIPEALPPGYPGLLEPRQPDSAAEALLRALTEDATPLREQFVQRFTLQTHLTTLARAIQSVEGGGGN